MIELEEEPEEPAVDLWATDPWAAVEAESLARERQRLDELRVQLEAATPGTARDAAIRQAQQAIDGAAVSAAALRGLALELEEPPVGPAPEEHDAGEPDTFKGEVLAARAQRQASPASEIEGWPELDPFDAVHLPPFPVDALATWQRDWARAEADFTQTPVDMAALLALASTALAVSRGVDVEVRDGWVEPTNLWVVCGAEPGERKSAVFDAATKPVFAYQAQLAKVRAPNIALFRSTKRVLEGQLAKAEKAQIDSKTFEGGSAATAVKRINEGLSELVEVNSVALLADDITAEAVAGVLATSGERLGIFSAEGGPFETMAGRYSDSKANLEIWLKSHSGDAHTVNRIKREAIYLRRPLLTLALTTQPSVIRGLAQKPGFRGTGLLARFIYCLPTSTVGARVVDSPRVPDDVRARYGAALIALLEDAGKRKARIGLSAGASRARAAYQAALEPRLGPDGDLRSLADWGGKLVGTIVRIAGVLHCSDYPHGLLAPSDGGDAGVEGLPEEIPLATWLRAEQIGDYALAHARQAFSTMGIDEAQELARRLLSWAGRRGAPTITAREAYRALSATPEAIQPALAELVDRGYLRRAPTVVRPGRPASPTYAIRPGGA
jgi:replicative DNA helicase